MFTSKYCCFIDGYPFGFTLSYRNTAVLHHIENFYFGKWLWFIHSLISSMFLARISQMISFRNFLFWKWLHLSITTLPVALRFFSISKLHTAPFIPTLCSNLCFSSQMPPPVFHSWFCSFHHSIHFRYTGQAISWLVWAVLFGCPLSSQTSLFLYDSKSML
jgi:hypothetical protein